MKVGIILAMKNLLESIGETIFKKLEKLLIFFNKSKYKINLNTVVITHNKIKYRFNINELNYEKSEIREIKRKIIEYYFRNLKLNISFKQHLFNYLIGKNTDISKKAKIIKYLLDKKFKVEKISNSFILKNDFNLLARFNITVKEIKTKNTNLNPISIILLFIEQYSKYKLLIKYFSSEKSNFDPNIKYTKILRTWLGLSENIYKNKLKKSLENTIIYVNPSIIKKSIRPQQKSYLDYLKVNDRNYFFYIPRVNYYHLLKIAIKIYFSPVPNQLKIPLLQVVKERIEIDDIVKYIKKLFPNVKEFYTKEEFLPESIYLTEKLKNSEIKVINCAHGLGVYGTIVNYDLFYVFSENQMNHYYGRGTAKFKIYELNKTPIQMSNNIIKKLAIFFIHQNVFSSSLRKTERSKKIYQEVINFVEKFAIDHDIPVYAKYHPGSTEKDKVLSNNITIIEKLEDLPNDYNYLAITLHSSYVLELLETMPFLIINPQNRINMKDFFPNNNSIYALTYKEFREKINKLLENPEKYYEYWNKLLSIVYRD